MTVRTSTGFKDLILGTDSLHNIFLGGIVDLYDGVQPASADDPVVGTHIARITEGGGSWTAGSLTNGMVFDTPSAGVIALLNPTDFHIVALADGTPTWFRIKGNTLDNNLLSTTLPRIDGAVSTLVGSDFVVDTVPFMATNVFVVNQLSLTVIN